MHKIIGVTLLVIGVFLLLRGHDLSSSLGSRLTNLAFGSAGARVTSFYLGGALCCAIGLVEFLRSEKK